MTATLKVLEGGHDTRPVTGGQVLLEMLDMLDERLPLVNRHDEVLEHLRVIQIGLGALRPARRPRRSR